MESEPSFAAFQEGHLEYTADPAFVEAVRMGLSADPKYLSSRYFYDANGDALFREIMHLEEYYLTDCEHEIFNNHKADLLDRFSGPCDQFHLIEFGAGDASKTKLLISHFLEEGARFEYHPIDISGDVLELIQADLGSSFPSLDLIPINLEYFEAVDEISKRDTCKKVILFLGSNIGNFTHEAARSFFRRLSAQLQKGDQLLVGFDLKKDPHTILKAYNDSKGITSAFNLNLLKRINREMDADFNPEAFYHYPVYDPAQGAARSYLISTEDQKVTIPSIPMKVEFREGEEVLMEISQKYDGRMINSYARDAGFRVIGNYYDRRKYFVNSLWEI
jgi:dimethylhistidine N-methyltransferase